MGVAQNNVYPWDVTILKTCHILSYFFRIVNILKSTAIIVTMVILDFNTLNGTNLQISTPKTNDEHTRHFYMEVPPGGKSYILLNSVRCV